MYVGSCQFPLGPTERDLVEDGRGAVMLVRLNVKLAEGGNGVDLSLCAEGDLIEVPERDGTMLIMEGWAEPAGKDEVASSHPNAVERAIAADNGLSDARTRRRSTG